MYLFMLDLDTPVLEVKTEILAQMIASRICARLK
jgi:hypothetical protein